MGKVKESGEAVGKSLAGLLHGLRAGCEPIKGKRIRGKSISQGPRARVLRRKDERIRDRLFVPPKCIAHPITQHKKEF